MPCDAAHRGILAGAERCSCGWLDCNALMQTTCNHAPLTKLVVSRCLLQHPRHHASCFNKIA